MIDLLFISTTYIFYIYIYIVNEIDLKFQLGNFLENSDYFTSLKYTIVPGKLISNAVQHVNNEV
jgi:hypothetical protein